MFRLQCGAPRPLTTMNASIDLQTENVDAEEILKQYDKDGDGDIDADEMREINLREAERREGGPGSGLSDARVGCLSQAAGTAAAFGIPWAPYTASLLDRPVAVFVELLQDRVHLAARVRLLGGDLFVEL
eukprot:gene4829-22494_t